MENKNALIWLKNGIAALAIAGLYSIILVILRTPQLSHFFSDQSMFRSALVIHVNLSVLVWLLAITCCIWSFSSIKTGLESLLARIAFAGMLLMAFSPFYPESEPIMNNYVPMLENLVFIIGLALFGTVVLLLSIQTLVTSFMQNISDYGERIIAITKFTSSFMFIGVWICFFISFSSLDELSEIVPLDIDFYYEMLFWSGGHLLQFIYTQLLMLVLLVLVESWRGGRVSCASVYEMLLALNFVLSLAVFIGHYRYGLADGAFKEFYTLHMIYTGGLVPTLFIATLLLEIIQKRALGIPKFVSVSFIASILLFLSGGAIGAVISGVNVTIPAHYHGSIVGISVAFMGLSYMFCFKQDIYQNIKELGGVSSIIFSKDNKKDAKIFGQKLAVWQIIILTSGQVLHVAGLALAGGYGVLRKTPGSEMALSAKLYMGMVGGGGLIAIIGGLIFVYICVINLYPFKAK
ncbi:MAG: cbb3-type cytochrome c oxidase subunit I [Rickettsiaceae bacterium]|nr:cbb3-type cytochrome c oxidase subunit I [Rickettsiaceae bacterium]MDP4832497.1 cbb3-type cytochrome c oxidase subunit I [Rickettsiaceae bacterium]MDP5020490.1 cbb3-type cytochrome c oxidase subunit I [Rickettsiaceae bacterium]MDP5083663.1 cbb3-type cytochrome c oxidase subunit I [Rickettsiaceae bacterium]